MTPYSLALTTSQPARQPGLRVITDTYQGTTEFYPLSCNVLYLWLHTINTVVKRARIRHRHYHSRWSHSFGTEHGWWGNSASSSTSSEGGDSRGYMWFVNGDMSVSLDDTSYDALFRSVINHPVLTALYYPTKTVSLSTLSFVWRTFI